LPEKGPARLTPPKSTITEGAFDMKTFATLLAVVLSTGAMAYAHGGNDHIRGIVTEISADSVTVQTADKKTTTVSLTAKTSFQKAKKDAKLADLKVGDRVVVDVPEGKTEALLVQIGAAPQAPAAVAKGGQAGQSR
jgi:hypothetical protein